MIWRDLRDECGGNFDMTMEHLLNLGIIERRFSLKHGEYFEPDGYSVEEELAMSVTGISLCRALGIMPA
jgi:hypothetical protein